MQLKLKVSNIACERCAEIITESTPIMEPEAKVDIDFNAKITVESAVSEESIKQVIVAAGYGLEGYSFSVSFAVYLIHVFCNSISTLILNKSLFFKEKCLTSVWLITFFIEFKSVGFYHSIRFA